jgi:hypothetical protein
MYETDDRGIYRIYGIAPGSYTVSIGESSETGSVRFGAGARGYYTRTFHPDVTDEAKAAVIEISEGTEASNIDISVKRKSKSFTASGRVLDESGKPAANIRIGNGAVMRDGKALGGFGWGTLSDATGNFRIDGLVPGRYAAFVWNDGEAESYSESAIFEIREGNVSGLELKLRRGATISGVAIIEGTADKAVLARLTQFSIGAFVEAEGTMAPNYSSVKIAPDGSFRLTGLRPGKARLYLANYPSPTGFALARVEREGLPQREIEITPGAQVTGLRIVLEYGTGSVRGLVRIENGQLPAEARMQVSARRRSGGGGDASSMLGRRGAQVDSRGRFLIEGMSEGEYELILYTYLTTGGPHRIAPVKQTVIITNGVEAEVNFTVDLSARPQPEGGNNE